MYEWSLLQGEMYACIVLIFSCCFSCFAFQLLTLLLLSRKWTLFQTSSKDRLQQYVDLRGEADGGVDVVDGIIIRPSIK